MAESKAASATKKGTWAITENLRLYPVDAGQRRESNVVGGLPYKGESEEVPLI